MTATERLRAMLDERGVEWTPSVWSAKDETFYTVGEVGFLATEMSNGRMKVCTAGYPTPEQVIEATLGRGECRDLAETPEYRDKTEFKCSECGYEYSAVGGFGCDYGDEPDFRYCPNCGRKVRA